MLHKKIQGTTASAILILLIFIIGLLLATAAALVADFMYVSSGILDFTLILIDLLIFVSAITIATFLAYKVGISISNDKNITSKHVSAVFACLAGIGVGLGLWTQLGGSPKPSIIVPIVISSLVQIVLYFIASIFVFACVETVRQKVWIPLVFIIMLIAPSVILYASRL